MSRSSLASSGVLLCAVALISSIGPGCADGPVPGGPAIRITGGVRSATQPQGEGNDGLGIEVGALLSSGLAIVALDTAGRSVTAPLSDDGTFALEVAPHASYTLNLLDTARDVYIASFLYRTGSSVDLALSVGDTDVALGECQVFNGEIWCDNGFFEPTNDDLVEPASDIFGRIRATVIPSPGTEALVTSLLGGTVLEYDLAPNPLNRFHVALTRHGAEGCGQPLTGLAEKVGTERYLYTDRVYTNATCQATVRFQAMCAMRGADRCDGFLRFDIVSSGTDCSEYPPMHVAEPVSVEVLEPGVVSCPLPPTCTHHSDCESGVCDNDVGFCASVPEEALLRVHVFDVGNGQAVLAVTPSGKSILMDAGRPQSGRMVAAMVRRMVPKLDMLVLSHFDADHAGGAVPLMLGPDGYPGRRGVDDDRINGVDDEGEIGAPGSDDLKPDFVLDRGLDPMPNGFDDYARILGSSRAEAVPGEVFDFGDGVTMTVLTVNGRVAGGLGHPVDEENARSVGVIFRYGDFTLANLGDLPAGGLGTERLEQLIIPSVIDDIPLDVHFLSHHGSKASSPPELLKALRPRVAVISVGDSDRCGAGFNSYGLPAQEVLDAVNEAGTIQRIYQTGEGGASFSGECVPNANQVYPREYGETPVAFAYSVFTIEASEARFRVRGLSFDEAYDAAGCAGDACSTCPIGYLENPDEPGRCIVDPCVPDPCNTHGACTFEGIGAFACACEGNWSGDRCGECETGYAGADCEGCAEGYLPDPGNDLLCVRDPCQDEPCGGRGACDVVAGGAFACACEPRFAGPACGECAPGYAGEGCLACAEGWLADPAAPSVCVEDPCVAAPCGERGTCGVEAGGAFACACLPNRAGATCEACAPGYDGEACDSCAEGHVEDPSTSGVCVVDLCASAPCGAFGSCQMASASEFVCICDGNRAGETCDGCREGWSGADCDVCAEGWHLEAGACVQDLAIASCSVLSRESWSAPGETPWLAAVVAAGEVSGEGRTAGVMARICLRDAPPALPIEVEQLTCIDEVPYAFDGASGDVYGTAGPALSMGEWYVVAAFSGDGGQSWTFCDADGVVGGNLSPGRLHVFNVPNGGFEHADNPLLHWETDGGTDVEAEIDVVHSGLRAVRLTRTTTVNADTDFVASPVPVVAGADYAVSMWFYDNDPSARANVIYAFYDEAGVQIGATSFGGVYTSDDPMWQQTAREVTAPAGAATLRVSTRIYSQSGGASTGGSIVVDDVAVTPL